MQNGRRYLLRCGHGYFDAGTISGGRQAVIWQDAANICVLIFDAHGKPIGHEVIRLSRPARPGPNELLRSDPRFEESAREQLASVRSRLNFTESDILVEPFSHDELSSGIEAMPLEYDEFLKDPGQFDPETRESLSTDVRQWQDECRFVLTLGGHEYWMSKRGEVLSHW